MSYFKNTIRPYSSLLALICVLSLICLNSCSSTSSATEGTYWLDVTLKGGEEGIVYLVKETSGKVAAVDSVLAVKGQFTMKGSIDQPELFYLQLKERPSIPIFLETGKITMVGYVDSALSMQVKGSPSHSELMEYMTTYFNFDKKDKALKEEYYAIIGNPDSTGSYQRIKTLMMEVKANTNQKAVFEIEYPIENISSPVGAYLAWVNLQLGRYREEADLFRTLEALKTAQPESPYTVWMTEKAGAIASTQIGKMAPDFEMPDLQGNLVKLSDFKGKYVLLDFWAGWCRPCRGENPNLVNIYNKYKGDRFEILGVSLDSEKAYWQDAVTKDGLTWPQVSDLNKWNSNVVELYGVKGIPFSLIIDPEGKILAKNLRGLELEQKIAELLQ